LKYYIEEYLNMLEKITFFNKHRITEEYIKEHSIDWEVLVSLYNDFIQIKPSLETQASYISEVLRGNKKVHTVRSRVKDPEHLIAKLVRKTKERQEKYGEDFQFNLQNYKEEITDLIGVRAIHIFKEDWEGINDFINNTWKVKEVKANVREGDSTEKFTELNIEIDKRKTGYRSVHYLIEFNPTIQKVIAEIQVRTIFEEGYGEIDHQLRYPHNDVPDVLELNLLMLNRVAGSSDEMASFINHLKKSWQEMVENHKKQVEELEKIIENSNMKETEKQTALFGIKDIKLSISEDTLITKNSYSFNNGIMMYNQYDNSALTTGLYNPAHGSSIYSGLYEPIPTTSPNSIIVSDPKWEETISSINSPIELSTIYVGGNNQKQEKKIKTEDTKKTSETKVIKSKDI
jgi:ppGpp synthetase/RelA/SpoT-type nucleotidyltranferase